MFLIANNKINITLCGMMGSGKSVVGKLLAKKIRFDFYDTDKLIEKKTNKSIRKIFEDSVEQYFRKLEEDIIIDILKRKNSIISLGGGAISNQNIRSVINQNSFNIYLKVAIDILISRLKSFRRLFFLLI